MLEVEDWNLVEVKIAVSECVPLLRKLTGPMAMPPWTGTGPPRLVAPSWNWMVPVAFDGVMRAVGIAIPPSPRGRGS